jgi:hypothetical protein
MLIGRPLRKEIIRAWTYIVSGAVAVWVRVAEWARARRLFAIVLGLATLLGVPAAVIAFWPRMTVSAVGLFDEGNAYSEIFTVANAGFLSFEDVHIGIGLCSIDTEKHDFLVTPNMCAQNDPHMLFTGPSWHTPELRRDEPFSVVLTDALNIATDKYRAEHPNVFAGMQMMSPLLAANIIFRVSFKPWPWPQYISKRYRFVAKLEPNGKMLWRAVPLSWMEIKLPN